MAKFVFLMKLTDQGASDVSQAAATVEEAFNLWSALGGELVSLSVTFGEYDFVGVVISPNDETAAQFAAGLAGEGIVSTVTMRGFGIQEFRQLLATSPVSRQRIHGAV